MIIVFFKQKTSYEMRIIDCSSDVCSSDLRTLVNNRVKGVKDGFNEELEINGVGLRAAMQGKNLQLNMGFSHEVIYPIPAGIEIKVEKPTSIKISGADKQLVGKVAADKNGRASWRERVCQHGKIPGV